MAEAHATMSERRSRFPAQVDVVVVGGGPAGSAAAIALVQRGASVLLLERSRYRSSRVGETLPALTQTCLRTLGHWETFVRSGHLPCVGIRSVWGDAETRERSCVFDPYGEGWHVDRRRFDADLADHAGAAGASVATGARPVAWERDGSRWRLRWQADGDGLETWCSFIIDATGRRALFSRRQGARRVATDHLLGVAAVVGGDGPSEPWALIEATEQGWWYSAPVPEGQIAIFMTDVDLVRGARLEVWEEALHGAPQTSARLAGRRRVGPYRCLGAASSRLDPVYGPGWLATGDAAAAHDPLSGQGVYRALRGGIQSADALAAACSSGESLLRQYAKEQAAKYSAYLAQRSAIYRRESRWLGSPFWARRRSGG